MTEFDPLLRRIGRQRRQARLTLWFERLWPSIWPALGVVGLFLCFALFDIPGLLPGWLHAAALAGFVVAGLALLWHGLRRVRIPGPEATDRRLEFASGLSHQPLSILTDRPAGADATAEALWRAHVARTATTLQRLRVGPPRPGLARHDMKALRGGLIVLLVAALVVAGPDAPARLLRALTPDLPQGAPPPAQQVQAWITPPTYTGLAPVFLKPEGGALTVPAGSHLQIDVTGGRGEPSLLAAGHAVGFQALDANSWQAQRELTSGGRITLRRRGRMVAAWDITTVADRAPMVAFAEPPGPAPRSLQTRLPWKVSHDYGVVALAAELRLRDRPDAPPVVVQIPLPGGSPKAAHGVALRDLSANPWAGLPVIARLVAHDGAGQQGVSENAAFILPERNFQHPVARALVAIRKMLSLHPNERSAAMRALDALARDPDAFDNDDGVFLNLQATIALLGDDPNDSAVGEAQDQMWQLALQLEERSVQLTQRAVEAARQAVQDQLDRMQKRDPADAKRNAQADKTELQRRMEALERAIEKNLQALAEQAQREGADTRFDPNAQAMTQQDLQRMMQQMEDAANQGRMDEAEQKMAQLQELLNELQNARPEHGQSNERQNAQRQRGRQQMGALQDMVQREGGLLDRAQQRAGQQQQSDSPPPRQNRTDPFYTPPGFNQQGFNQQGFNQQNSGQQDSGQQSANTPPSAADQQQQARDGRTQQALRRALGELMQQFGDLTGKIPDSLGEADRAMEQSGQALGKGQDGQAAGAEQRAIEALQKGGQEMGQQMAQQFGLPQPGEGQGQDGQDQAGDGSDSGYADTGNADGSENGQPGPDGRRGTQQQNGRRDPLGRLTRQGTSGSDDGDDVRVPEQMEQARTREIQEELRRRGGERDRPQEELDYINRLLKTY
jgi:uncharacterized protein (TIGR02302 family)